MKKLGLLLLLATFIASCGTKKRTTASRKEIKENVSTGTANSSSDYPMPEDTGRFVRFPISSVEEYIDTFSEIAQFEMKAYGIPASITLAQGILESGIGQGELTRKTNNHFGIKCHNGWTGEFERHDDDAKGECFRKYNHPMYSFRDHSIFLSSRPRYAFLFEFKKDDYKRWAHGLKKAGYATDPRYPKKLISFIERYDLARFDKEVLSKGYLVTRKPRAVSETVHVVEQGDTLYSLSQKYFISIEDIMKQNDLKDTNLRIGQRLEIRSTNIRK